MTLIATVKMESISPYSQSRFYEVEKQDKETPDAYEKRTWRERCHYDLETRKIFLPPMSFKKSLDSAASFLSEKIKGQRNATYTKHFKAGILVVDRIDLEEEVDTVEGEWLFVPSDGKPGGGTRVKKCFPLIHKWAGKVDYLVLDMAITKDVFERHVKEAGNFIGVGRFRPERGGFYGRYKVNSITWREGL